MQQRDTADSWSQAYDVYQIIGTYSYRRNRMELLPLESSLAETNTTLHINDTYV